MSRTDPRNPALKGGDRDSSLADELDAIARRCAALPVVDARSADEIIGYDEHGVPR
jgi:antitoxin VapB